MELENIEEALINRIGYCLNRMDGNNITEDDCNISGTISNLATALVSIQEYLSYKNGGDEDGKEET